MIKLNIFFKYFISLITLLAFISCAAFPANKVKLKNYQQVTQKDLDQISLVAKNEFSGNLKPYIIKGDDELYATGPSLKNPKCVFDYDIETRNPFPNVCLINYFVAGVTIFTIPYYCQLIYETKGTLYANIIDPITKQPSRKVLKTYYLKDKVHEVWSVAIVAFEIAALPFMFIHHNLTKNNKDSKPLRKDSSNIPTAYGVTTSNISQAMARMAVKDALTFEECRK